MSATLAYLLAGITIAAVLYVVFFVGEDSKIVRFIQHWGDRRLQPHPFRRGLMVAMATWLLTTCALRPDLIVGQSPWAKAVGDVAAILLLLFAVAVWIDGFVIWLKWKREAGRG